MRKIRERCFICEILGFSMNPVSIDYKSSTTRLEETNTISAAFMKLSESSTIPEVSGTATKIKRKVRNGIIADVFEESNKSLRLQITTLARPESKKLTEGIYHVEYLK